MLVTVASAGIRRVGLNQTYTTLTAAYTAAVNDDTLLISPGGYNETITSTKRLHWIGAGYDRVTINGRLLLNSGSSGSSVDGIGLTSSTNGSTVEIASAVDFIQFKRSSVKNTNTQRGQVCTAIKRTTSPGGMLLLNECIVTIRTSYEYPYGGFSRALELNGDNLSIRNSIIALTDNNGTAVVGFSGTCQSFALENSAVVGFSQLFDLAGNFPFLFRNNIAHDWIGSGNWGTYPGGGTGWSYNASTTITPQGSNTLLLANDPFVNYDETANYIYGNSDLHLANGSPCIDAGDPAILDLDGSRSDMGIYGGPTPHVDGGAPNYPFTIAFDVPSSMTAGQQLPIQATGRIGAGY